MHLFAVYKTLRGSQLMFGCNVIRIWSPCLEIWAINLQMILRFIFLSLFLFTFTCMTNDIKIQDGNPRIADPRCLWHLARYSCNSNFYLDQKTSL